jgi:hypothetical protein
MVLMQWYFAICATQLSIRPAMARVWSTGRRLKMKIGSVRDANFYSVRNKIMLRLPSVIFAMISKER